jgi:hypothetical protein
MFDDPAASQDSLPTTPIKCKIDVIALPVGIAPPECRVVGLDPLQQRVAEGFGIGFGHPQRSHE